MNLIPEVKKLEKKGGFLLKNYIKPFLADIDNRILKAADKIPTGDDGASLTVNYGKDISSEAYELEITEDKIIIDAEGVRGAFYAIQTLRQILRNKNIPCVKISDEPDFSYRGIYHDVSRGKVPTVKTLKDFIDKLAYFKINSLQLYIEHTFEFEETKELTKITGALTKEEILELDSYAYENFVEFVPSVATFGHMFEILEMEKFRDLRVLKDYDKKPNFWLDRMRHHTIDPLNEKSINLIKSLIDQYAPLFSSDKFNICGDETFDLKRYDSGVDAGKMYLDFTKKIVSVVRSHEKKVMMWGDVMLNHPEIIPEIPDEVICLSWDYHEEPDEEKIIRFKELGKTQIVCPGTGTWSRFTERVSKAEKNISKMIDYGKKHGAVGMLNTNWGDYGNPCSIEMAMYGIVLSAAKSWNVLENPGEEFYKKIDDVLYGGEGAFSYLRKVSDVHEEVANEWNALCCKYFELRFGEKAARTFPITEENTLMAQEEMRKVISELSSSKWEYDEAREELILSAEAVIMLAEYSCKLNGLNYKKTFDLEKWLNKYKEKWLNKNKESELGKISEMLLYIEEKK